LIFDDENLEDEFVRSTSDLYRLHLAIVSLTLLEGVWVVVGFIDPDIWKTSRV